MTAGPRAHHDDQIERVEAPPAESPSTAGRVFHRSDLRPYWVEIFVILQLVVFHSLLLLRGVSIGDGQLGQSLLTVPPRVAMLVGLGFACRLLYLLARGRRSEASAWLRDRHWWLNTVRFLLVGALLSHVYTWLKVLIPALNGHLFDAEIAAIERFLMGGHQPFVFMLQMFSQSTALRVFDAYYGNVFIDTLAVSVAFFLSHRDDRIRLAFVNGFVLLWSAAVWTHVAIPTLGPVYFYPEVYAEFRENLVQSFAVQHALLENYRLVRGVGTGVGLRMINPLLGIAAFPSLHVGHLMFVAWWVRRDVRPLTLPVALVVAFMFVGSVVTGWHYALDSVAGIVLAYCCARAGESGARAELRLRSGTFGG